MEQASAKLMAAILATLTLVRDVLAPCPSRLPTPMTSPCALLAHATMLRCSAAFPAATCFIVRMPLPLHHHHHHRHRRCGKLTTPIIDSRPLPRTRRLPCPCQSLPVPTRQPRHTQSFVLGELGVILVRGLSREGQSASTRPLTGPISTLASVAALGPPVPRPGLKRPPRGREGLCVSLAASLAACRPSPGCQTAF